MTFARPRASAFHLGLSFVSVGAAVIMLLVYLGHNGFWIDELYTLHSIRLGWKEMILERLHRGHFPAYFVLARLWYGLWPEPMFELGLRSLSVIFYLAALASFWLLTHRVLPAPKSYLALALFACNEIALRQASEARMYTLVLLVAVWITRCWYELQQPDAPRRWRIFLPILSVIGFAVSATTGVLIGAMLIVSLFISRDMPLSKRLAVALALGLAIFVPGAISHMVTADRIGVAAIKPMVFLAHPVALMPGVQIWDDYLQETPLLYTLLFMGIAITLFAIYTLWKKRRELPAELRRMALIVPVPLLFITACYPLIELFELSLMGPPRYYLSLLPMASLLGAWTLMQVRRPALMHAALTLFLLTSAWSILTIRTEPFREQILQNLKPYYKPGDGLIVTPPEIEDGVELYLPGAQVDEAVSRMELDPDVVRQQIQHLGSRRRVWVVWYRGKHSPIPDVARELWTKLENRKMKDFSGVRIYSFSPRADTRPAAP